MQLQIRECVHLAETKELTIIIIQIFIYLFIYLFIQTTVYLAIEPRDAIVYDEFLSQLSTIFNVNKVPIMKLDVKDKAEPVSVFVLKKKIS